MVMSVCQWLFEVGAKGDITKAINNGATPMLGACQEGHLSVCQWLFEVGAKGDITKADEEGYTPMLWACNGGHLSVCQWLFEVGAKGDITKADSDGYTPMLHACKGCHLSTCQWLFEVGAAGDITNASNGGVTPLFAAYYKGHLPVCQWLVLNGALNRLPPEDEESDDEDAAVAVGHVDPAIVERDLAPREADEDDSNDEGGENHRLALLAWAQNVVAVHHTFLNVVLSASIVLPNRRVSPRRFCRLPLLPRGVLERVGLFVGVEMGRRLRNVREFSDEVLLLGGGRVES